MMIFAACSCRQKVMLIASKAYMHKFIKENRRHKVIIYSLDQPPVIRKIDYGWISNACPQKQTYTGFEVTAVFQHSTYRRYKPLCHPSYALKQVC